MAALAAFRGTVYTSEIFRVAWHLSRRTGTSTAPERVIWQRIHFFLGGSLENWAKSTARTSRCKIFQRPAVPGMSND
jgi:hypothetical protein